HEFRNVINEPEALARAIEIQWKILTQSRQDAKKTMAVRMTALRCFFSVNSVSSVVNSINILLCKTMAVADAFGSLKHRETARCLFLTTIVNIWGTARQAVTPRNCKSRVGSTK
ncbi:MAG: hypothetical protein ACKO0V_04215, partial [bacterium]